MMDDIFNFIHREIDRRVTGKQSRRLGEVTSYDKKAHAVKLKIQPEGHETGWVPLNVIGVGNKWGVVIGAEVGDQYEADFQEGDFEVGRITARVHSDEQKPPEVESGEIAHVTHFNHQILMKKDGSISIVTNDKDVAQQNQNTSPQIGVSASHGSGSSATNHQIVMDPVGGKLSHFSTNGTVTHSTVYDLSAGHLSHTSSTGNTAGTPASQTLPILPNLPGMPALGAGGSLSHSTIFDVIAGTLTHSTVSGSSSHSISLSASSGISSNSTGNISHSAGGNISHSASGNISHTASGTITHNAPTVNIPQVLKVAGSLAIPGLSSFANNAAAAAGGVPAGSVFVSSVTNALTMRV